MARKKTKQIRSLNRPPVPKGLYRDMEQEYRSYTVFGSDDWVVYYWDVYHLDDGPRMSRRNSSRIQWEFDLERGVIVHDV